MSIRRSGSARHARHLAAYAYVKVRTGDRMSLFPDFLVVGPQRTGTTWLYQNLRRHPEIFMPAKKELYFFNLLADSEHPKYQSSELGWYLSHFRVSRVKHLARRVANLARWGEPFSIRIRGEATASYAAMEPEIIEELASLQPDLKVVITVRDPVSRAWSHAVKDLVKRPGKSLDQVSKREWLEYFTDPYQMYCGRFSKIIDNWQRYFGVHQVFLGRFEDIEHRPLNLLARMYSFLGVNPRTIDVNSALQRFNEGRFPDIPDSIRSVLVSLFEGERRELESRYGWKYAT